MAKKLNVPVIVFSSIILVGFILVIVGMCSGIVAAGGESVGLFDEVWDMYDQMADAAAAAGASVVVPTNTFTLISFVFLILASIMALTDAILGIFGLGIKGLGIAGGVLSIIAGVFVLTAGMILAGEFNSLTHSTLYSPGIGIWIGGFAGILIGVMGIIAGVKGAKKKAAPAAAPAA